MSTLSERVQKVLDETPQVDQPTLGKIAGVTKGTVNQWLDGKIKSMKLEYAARIQKKLGYSAVWLVLGEGEERLENAYSLENVKSSITTPSLPLSFDSARQERARFLAERLLDVSPEMREMLEKLIDVDHEGGATREMTIAGVGYVLRSIPQSQSQKKVK